MSKERKGILKGDKKQSNVSNDGKYKIKKKIARTASRAKWFRTRTWLFVFVCMLIVFLQRWEDITWMPLTFSLWGITFSTSDFFMIVAAGICGYTYGAGGFLLLFAGEVARTLPEVLENMSTHGHGPRGPIGMNGGTDAVRGTGQMIGQLADSISQGMGGQESSTSATYFTMFIYLIIILLSGYFARKRWYRGWKKPMLAIFLLTIVLGSSLYVVMNYLTTNMTTVYDDMSLTQMYVGVIPETVLGVLVVTLFYKLAPDSIKNKIGEGHLYTNEYEEYLKTSPIKEDSPLGKMMLLIVAGQTLLLSLFAVIVFDFQMNGMMPEGIPRGKELIKMDFQMMLLIFCIVMPIAMAVHEIVQRRMVKPINEMKEVMKGYFASKDSSRQLSVEKLENLDIHTGDEIEELHHAFITMVTDMSDYIGVMQREMELKEDLAAAEAESRAKSAFLSSMSHEIRTPINAVLGMDEMILRESREDTTIEYAENIKTAGNSLLGLINDILDFSKIEAGKMDIIPVEYETASVLNDLINMIRQRAEDKHLELIVEADSNIPTMLYGDEIRFKQVVTNILTNAVKYTEAGSVTMSVKADKIDDDNVDVYVSIRDTGIGIKEEDINKLFSAFERIEEERNRNIEGTGLGMNITNQLLSMMGSRLEVESVYGEGSVFSFHLKQKVVKWEPIGDFREALRRSFAGRHRYHESFTAPEARILAVDDTVMNLSVFRGLLKQTKVQIDTAESGEECLKLMTEKIYDMVFLDHRMPGMDGVETRHRMDSLENNMNVDTPVIALTANAVSGAREEYISYGFTDYLTKPIDSKMLEKMIVKYLPEDKVIINTDDDTGVEETEEDKESPGVNAVSSIEDLPVVEGLDWHYAATHLPDVELIETALNDFYKVIDIHADRLDGYYSELPESDKAWEDYRILVHGMKSSAATIGITTASGMARMLENASGSRDYDVVSRLHDVFLEEWRSYKDRLTGIFGLGNKSDDNAETYDPEVIRGLIQSVDECMQEFDTDKADAIIELLKGYTYPDDIRRDIDKLAGAVADVDPDSVSEIVKQVLKKLGE